MSHQRYNYSQLCQSDGRVIAPGHSYSDSSARMASIPGVVFRVATDVVCVAIVAIPVLLFKVLGQPFKRGFFCDDQSLMHPHKDSTIPTVVLGIIGIGVTSIVVLIVESIRLSKRCSKKSDDYPTSKPLPFLQRLVVRCYTILVPFYFGAVLTQLFTDIGKFSIGRLRPHFFDVCKPDFSKINCTLGYIEDYTCLGSDEVKIRNSMLSFPSGHSSLSVYTMIYFALYIQVAIPRTSSQLIRPLLQLIVILMAYYTCVSRIYDYKHHWSDVLAGAILGICTSLVTAFFISPLFTKPKRPSNETEPLTGHLKADGNSATTTRSSVVDIDADPIKK